MQRVWNWYSALFQVTIREDDNCLQRFKAWINSSQHVVKGHIRILLPMLIGWFSWKARNDSKFNNQAIRIIHKIQTWLFNMHLARPFKIWLWGGDLQLAHSWQIQFVASIVGRSVALIWHKPPAGFIKINSDGAFNQRNGKAAVGGLIRDEDGRIIEAYQIYLGNSSVLKAELHGIWKGLALCERHNWRNVCVWKLILR